MVCDCSVLKYKSYRLYDILIGVFKTKEPQTTNLKPNKTCPLLIIKIKVMGISDKLFQMKQEKAAANLKASQDFLEANKQKPGIVTLPSGLQYEVLVEGTGAKPTATSNVT